MYRSIKTDAGVVKFLSRHPIFRARNFTWAPDRSRENMDAQNQIAHPIKTQLEHIVLCSLLPK